MAWWLLIVIFWKPLYLGGRYIYSKFVKKDGSEGVYTAKLSTWGLALLELVKP